MLDGGRRAAKRSLDARIRAARERERALGGFKDATRSRAALRDRLLAALAGADGPRQLVRAAVAATSVRHPRAGGALRKLAGRMAARRPARRSRRS